MSEQDLIEFAIAAVDQRAKRSVMPMIAEIGDSVQFCGTAILFVHKGSYFIITADHVARDLDKFPIGVPASPMSSELWQIGNATKYACQYDLAMVHLHDEILIERILSAWRPLNLNDVRQPHLSGNALYFIYGFPSSTSQFELGIARSNPISLITRDFDGKKTGFAKEFPYDAKVDHLLAYSTTAIDPRTGCEIGDFPPTRGMSGSPVWQISREALYKNDDIWSPESKVRIIGFYTSDHENRGWLRVRRSVVIDGLLNKLGACRNTCR